MRCGEPVHRDEFGVRWPDGTVSWLAAVTADQLAASGVDLATGTAVDRLGLRRGVLVERRVDVTGAHPVDVSTFRRGTCGSPPSSRV